MSEETFLNIKQWRWFRISFVVTVTASLLYYFSTPTVPMSGSTFYGYLLGIICGACMVYLLWYGSRKRRYFAQHTTLKEVLSAHVWIGIALLVLVPLHCGFRFHWNVHTMTFVFCILTIVTGIWGAYLYRVLPKEILSNRGEGNFKILLEQYHSRENEIVKSCEGRSEIFVSFIKRFDHYSLPKITSLLSGKRSKELDHKEVAALVPTLPENERKEALQTIALIDKKFEALKRIEREALVQCWLKLWLYLHVPLACGATMLLIIHVVSVLYYA